jgi:hypothetical protein
MTTLRTVLAYAVANDYCVEQADADNAYVQATLSEEIYVEAPVGFDSGGPVLRLMKALYGLKQAGRAWYMHLKMALSALGFEPCATDPCLFARVSNNKLQLICAYVDDFVVVAKTSGDVQDILP